MEVDVDLKNTGETKVVNGFDTRRAVLTITMREKGKTLEESGGMVVTSDMWMTPQIEAMKEVAEFDLKYAQKVYGNVLAGAIGGLLIPRFRRVTSDDPDAELATLTDDTESLLSA